MGVKKCCCQAKGSSSDVSMTSTRSGSAVLVLTYTCSAFHALMGIMSAILGIIASRKAEVWMAHRVSPIWSGGFFLLTAITGITTARKRTPYLVMCFGALCVVSMVVGVVCIQLLKLGLVTHLSDGATHKQDELDFNVVLALASSGFEILICILSFPVCCQLAVKVKEEVHMKRDGTFSIQVLGDKDIVIQQSDSASYERLYEDDTVSDLAKYSATGDCSNLLLATVGLASPSSLFSNENRLGLHSKGAPAAMNREKTTTFNSTKYNFASIVNLAASRKPSVQSDKTQNHDGKLEPVNQDTLAIGNSAPVIIQVTSCTDHCTPEDKEYKSTNINDNNVANDIYDDKISGLV